MGYSKSLEGITGAQACPSIWLGASSLSRGRAHIEGRDPADKPGAATHFRMDHASKFLSDRNCRSGFILDDRWPRILSAIVQAAAEASQMAADNSGVRQKATCTCQSPALRQSLPSIAGDFSILAPLSS
jgi:hypothetical protein